MEHTVGMKGSETWNRKEFRTMTHDNVNSPTNSQSDIERSTQRGVARFWERDVASHEEWRRREDKDDERTELSGERRSGLEALFRRRPQLSKRPEGVCCRRTARS